MGFFVVCALTFVFGYGFIRYRIHQSTKEFNEFVDRTIPGEDDIMPL